MSGLTFTVRDMIDTWSTWFSNCWYTMKKTRATIPAVVEWRNAKHDRGHGAEGGTDQGDEVGEAHEEPEHAGVGHAEQGSMITPRRRRGR